MYGGDNPTSTLPVPRPPFSIRAVNRVGRTLRRLGWTRFELDADILLARAQRETGLHDFGDDEFLPPLRVLIDEFREAPHLSHFGELTFRRNVLSFLKHRLEAQHDRSRFPEIGEIRIDRPVFIVGLPRTGTTLLHTLLTLDPRARWLRSWELQLTRLQTADERARVQDERRRKLQRQIAVAKRLAPEMDKMHDFAAPAECMHWFAPTFHTELFHVSYHAATHRRWLCEVTQEQWLAPYRFYRSELQRLLWYEPGERWVLKAPIHLEGLAALRTIFPDARIIHLHRNLQHTVGSACRYYGSIYAWHARANDASAFVRSILDYLVYLADRARQMRTCLDSAPFLDIDYQELVQEPRGVVDRIYEHLSLDVSAVFDDALSAWLKRHHVGRDRGYSYHLEQFGLSAGEIDTAFRDYCDHFGVVR